jgi:hypothetical protein
MSMLPMDDRDGVIWLDGALVPWRDARIHVWWTTMLRWCVGRPQNRHRRPREAPFVIVAR